MATKTIKHGLFRFHRAENAIINGEEKEILVEHMAFHNQTVDIPRDADLERGEKYGAFWTPDEARAHYAAQGSVAPGLGHDPSLSAPQAGADGEVEEVELSDLDHEDLVDWLLSTGRFDGQKKPTADEVVAAAEDDPSFAERLLIAEREATGDTPRKSVQDGLTKINPDIAPAS